MDIVEFLRARLDEDEDEARKAIVAREQARPHKVHPNHWDGPDYTFEHWNDWPDGMVMVGPERVLREVEAKRELLRWAHDLIDAGGAEGNAAEVIITALAVVYSDHPDYDPGWCA